MTSQDDTRFIVDLNVGKLARWLRLMGYDTLFLPDLDDGEMVELAIAQNRVLLTRDTRIVRRRVAASGQLKVLLLDKENPREQLREVVQKLHLSYKFNPFSRCLECNGVLEPKTPTEVKDEVPPYVFKTQSKYMQCPACHRIYWRGTHWQAMTRTLERWQEVQL